MKLRLLSYVVPALLVAACGSLPEDPSETEGLATLQGELTNQGALPLDGNVRIAVIWRRPDVGGQISFSVAEDVPVEPVFPSKFRVVLHNAPPESAMVNIGEVFGDGSGGDDDDDDVGPTEPAPLPPQLPPPAPTPAPGGGDDDDDDDDDSGTVTPAPPPPPAPVPAGDPARSALAAALRGRASALKAQAEAGSPWPADLRVATGTLVAYVDDNQNGRLDLVEEGAPGFLDRVVATNQDLILAYFEGTIPNPFPDLEAAPTPGYNLIPLGCRGDGGSVNEDDVGGVPGGETFDPIVCEPPRPMPASEPFQLPITSDPGLNDLMCQNGGEGGSGSDSAYSGPQPVTEQPAAYPAPDAPGLHCAVDGASYYQTQCETYSEGICKGVTTTCTTIGYQRPEPAPAAWPCPPAP